MTWFVLFYKNYKITKIMILAVATIKKLPLHNRKTIKYQLSRVGVEFKERFDLSKHTLAFDCIEQKLYESSTKKLSSPNVKWLTAEDFVKAIRSGSYNLIFKEFQKAQKESVEKVDTAITNDKTIEHHVTYKPMLREDLKKLKRTELIDKCKSLNINGISADNKQQLINKIITKLVENEQA